MKPSTYTSLAAALFVLGASEVSTAGNTAFQLLPGEHFSVSCAGELSQPSHSGATWSMTCRSDDGPPEPPVEPTPPPSQGCKQPTGNSRRVKIGEEAPVQLSAQPVNRHFCSRDYPKGLEFTWGQYSASSFSALTVIVSETVNNVNINSVDRACFRGGQNDRLNVSPTGGCRMKANTLYYLSITARHPVNGKPTGSGQRQITLNSYPNR